MFRWKTLGCRNNPPNSMLTLQPEYKGGDETAFQFIRRAPLELLLLMLAAISHQRSGKRLLLLA
jgi:hypothetical protein